MTARDLLRAIEWGPEPISDVSECAWCLMERREGHAADCALLALATDDNGLALMLTLVLEKAQCVENTLERTRQIMDNDEVPGMGFVLEHNAWCPKIRASHGPRYCACGLDDLHDDLREARVEMEAIRASLNHALTKLEVAK